MTWWMVIAVAAALAGFVALVGWLATAFWVQIISNRWNAMCAEEPYPNRIPCDDRSADNAVSKPARSEQSPNREDGGGRLPPN